MYLIDKLDKSHIGFGCLFFGRNNTFLFLIFIFSLFTFNVRINTFAQDARNSSSTTNSDSLKTKRKVKIGVNKISFYNLKNGKDYRDSIRFDFLTIHKWDELDTLSGFQNSLGLIGKPYRNYRYGLPDYYFDRNHFRNPVRNEPYIYAWNNETQIPFYDTKTPYTNVEFAQSANETQVFRVLLSQNISQYWNSTLHYRRRSSIGAYRNNTTDHYNLSFSNHFHTFDRKLNIFGILNFNQLNDALNGGAFQLPDPDKNSSQNTKGVLSDARLFDKNATLLWFNTSPAKLTGRIREAIVFGEYKIGSDSSKLALVGLAGMILKEYVYSYIDPTDRDSLTTIDFLKNPFRPYGNIYRTDKASNTRIPLTIDYLTFNRFEKYKVDEQYYSLGYNPYIGARGRINFNSFKLISQYELHFESTKFSALNNLGHFPIKLPEGTNSFNKQTQRIFSTMRIPGIGIQLENEIKFSVSNLFSPEFYFDIHGNYKIKNQKIIIRDSTVIDTTRKRNAIRKPFIFITDYAPIVFEGAYLLNNLNPSIFHSFWNGATFVANPNLNNELISHLRFSVKWESRPKVRKGYPFRTNSAKFIFFVNQINSMISFDTEGKIFQVPFNEPIRSVGAEWFARIGWKRIYLETTGSIQTFQTTSSEISPIRYINQSIPKGYGKVILYYENKIPKTGLILHLSIEAIGFTSFNGYHFDPSTQIFFPQTLTQQPAYGRIDVTAAGKFGEKVYFFAKFIHANEGIFAPGYTTTPYYPMLNRSLSIGLNWTLFD